MDREEVLAHSRREKRDEGEEYAENRGRRLGETGMLLMFFTLFILNGWHGIDNAQVGALFLAYVGMESCGRYTVTRNRKLLVSGGVSLLCSLLWLLHYIWGILGA